MDWILFFFWYEAPKETSRNKKQRSKLAVRE
uniref:Uncharacterized protein n=1 Tax=Arundo donax TaxID=35708 RepID=A0A0A9H3R6_ARUDO